MNTNLASVRVLSRIVVVAGVMLVASSENAHAVAVSASYGTAGTNHMGLPAVGSIFDPGLPDFGALGLVAPGAGTNSVTIPLAYPANAPNAANKVQMFGDAVSTVTNLGAGAFQVEVTLTNFFMNQGTAAVTDEYVYLNVWETFTGLGVPASLMWSTAGTISIIGPWSAGAASFVAIEPTAIVFDPGASTWGQASPFFGANGTGPGGGLLVGSKAVNSLTPYVSAGQVSVGMQTILIMKDPLAVGGALMHLPTSLHMSVTLTPVPVPEPSTLALAGAGLVAGGAIVANRLRQRQRKRRPRQTI
jgi:hypothetical protein